MAAESGQIMGAREAVRWMLKMLSPERGFIILALVYGAAGSGIGLGLLPECYLASETHGAEVVAALDIDGWDARRSIAAAWRSGAAFSEGFRTIAEFIREYVQHD